MKKRILSCILCLTLLLGIMPTALAEEGGVSAEPGLYADAELAQLIEITEEDYAFYRVSYPIREEFTVYYYHPTDTVRVEGNSAVSVENLGSGVYAITLAAGNMDTVFVELRVLDENGDGPNCPLEFVPEVTLPDGHGQLYCRNRVYAAHSALNSPTLPFTLEIDGEILTGDGWTAAVSSDRLGAVVYDENVGWIWDLGEAIPGASGFITLTDGSGNNYSIYALVEQAAIGIYTTSAVDSSGYIPRLNRAHTVSYNGENGTRAVYAISGMENVSILSGSITNDAADAVDVTLLDNGALEIALKDSVVRETVSARVSVAFQETDGSNVFDGNMNFTIVFEAVYDLPTGHSQLYNYGETFISGLVGGGHRLSLTTTSDGTPIAATGWTASCTAGLGEVLHNGQDWVWDLNNATIGATGFITLMDGTNNYSIAVEAGAPYVGVYSSDSISAESYLPEVQGICTATYAEMTGTRVVYIIPGLANMQILNDELFNATTSDVLDVTWISGRCVKIALKNEIAGGSFRFTLPYNLQNTNTGETERRTCTVLFRDANEPAPGMYADAELKQVIERSEADRFYHVSYTPGESVTVYYYDPDNTVTVSGNSAVSVEGPDGGVYAITLAAGNMETVLVELRVLDENGDGPNFPLFFDPIVPDPIPSHEILDSEKLPLTWADLDKLGSGPVPFEYDNDTYYVGRGHDQPDLYGGSWPDWDETVERESKINFWIKDKEGNYKAVDEATRKILLDQFTSLTLTVYSGLNESGEYATHYPTQKFYANGTVEYIFTNQHSGLWIYVVEGTLKDGTELVAYSWFSYEFISDDVYEATSVADANERLADIISNCPDDIRYIIQLPAGTLEGEILIPEGMGIWNITIRGAVDENNNRLTTLKGGINANAGFCTIEDLTLQGAGMEKAGKWLKNWPKDSGDLAGKRNVGLTGSVISYYFGCEFRDYDIAVECTKGLRWGGDCTRFINNRVGIYVDTDIQSGGATDMSRFYFEGNDTAVYIKKLHPGNGDLPMSGYRIILTRFIDNNCDIHNATGKMFFVSGNYFEHDGNSHSALDGKERPWLKGKVYIAPIYTSWSNPRSITEEVFFSGVYWGTDTTVRNGSTDGYALTSDDLSGLNLTVIDQPDTANQVDVTFSFSEIPATFGLRRTRSVETFDPTVVIEKGENEIKLTINALPTGQMPAMSVSCGDWENAVVTFDGAEIASSLADGAVSFVAEAGGTYTITKTEVAGEPEAPEQPETPEQPQQPVLPPVVIPTVSDTSTEKRTNADGSTTTIVTDKKTGTVTETTEYSDGTVLEIVTDKNGKQEISVSVPENTETTVEIPVKTISAGTIAVIVHADGTEEIVSHSVPGENGLLVTLDESAVLKIVDNAKTFSDVKDKDWFSDAVDFVSARGIMSGTGVDQFGHDSETTRAMIWTMLARMDGIDTDGGANWYERGMDWAVENDISDGSNASGAITREQLAVMLWRLSGSPRVYESSLAALGRFADGESVSSYAQEAMAWAVANGILGGMGDGTLNPGGNATRAQVAQIMMNYMMNI